MTLYYIRHAPTAANVAGEIVKDYDNQSIINFDVDKWKWYVGCHLPRDFKLFVSPAKRCKQTAEALFPGKEYTVLPDLAEFDISELAESGLKFWEIDEETFNQKVYLRFTDIVDRWNNALIDINASSPENVVVIGHGFYGRLVRELYEKTGDHIFDILNSKNFQFRNLDVMKIERCQVTNVWRNDETASY